MTFPGADMSIGSIWLPHHFVLGAWAALFVCWLVTEDGTKPMLAVSGLLLALFSWYHILWTYPVTGTVGVLSGLAIATLSASLRQPWRFQYPQKFRMLFIGFILIAWDDAIEHTFGLWMPLDWIWDTYLYHLIA